MSDSWKHALIWCYTGPDLFWHWTTGARITIFPGQSNDRKSYMSGLAWIFDDSIQPQWAIELEDRINNKLEMIVATLQEALDGWKAYVADLKAQVDAAVNALTDANSRAQAAADALAQFQADDAATDASQLAAQAQADADAVQAALDEVKTPVEPPPVVEEPVTPDEPAPEEPPAEPVV